MRRLLNSRRRQEITIAEHQAILDHIQQRNANGAANAMGAHLDAVMTELETFAAANPGLFADLQTKAGWINMKKKVFKAPSGASISFTELGMGTAPLGNLYRPVSEKDAQSTLEAAWKAGIRYFDTAPFYGLGLSENRLNLFFRGHKRNDYVVSTKVGRLLEVCKPEKRAGIGKFFATPTRAEVFDYTYDGIMRSLEFSLERLGLDYIDILYVHDIDVYHPRLGSSPRQACEDADGRRLQGAAEAQG